MNGRRSIRNEKAVRVHSDEKGFRFHSRRSIHEQLTQFALRLVLTGHTDTPRENDLDYLAQAAAVFEIKKPRASKAKDRPAAKKPPIVEPTARKEATKKKAA